MKVTQQSEPKFIPVVITLESQEEVDIIHNCLDKSQVLESLARLLT